MRSLVRVLAVLAAAAALTAAAPFASAAPHTQASAKPHAPERVNHSKVISARKATAAEVASGFAASTASAVVTCLAHSQMHNPYDSGRSSVYLQMWIGWEESRDANGTPEARIKNSTSIVMHNNANNGTTGVFFGDAHWLQPSYIIYQHTTRAYDPPATFNVVKGGQQLGITVKADGNADTTKPAVGYWINESHQYWGFRQFLAYAPNAGAYPQLNTYLARSDGSFTTLSEYRIYADGACGDLILY
jgi:hypothetical protein